MGGFDVLAVIGIGFEADLLPVEMLSFTATEKNTKSELKWSTATEINNHGFVIERSADGKDWKEIGFVASRNVKGSSNEKLDYDFTDNNPLTGINYYRLRQVDMDNHQKISEIRILSINGDNAGMAVFPNPVSDNIYIHGITPGTNLQLTDTRAVTIYRTSAAGSDVAIPANKLVTGIYFLHVTYNNALVKTIKVIKK